MRPLNRERFAPTLIILGCALLGAALIAGFVEPAAALLRQIPFDYNEGWNAYWAQAAMQGKALYPPLLADVTNNYPPLSFYVVGAVGWLFGDFIFAGRVISFVALCVLIFQIGLWLRVSGSSRGTALCGAALFTAMFTGLAHSYIGVDDPQLLAHALMLTGLLVLWSTGFNPKGIILGAILMMSAGFTKHLLIPIPLASTLWIFFRHRSRFMLWLCSCAAVAFALCASAYIAYGPALFDNLLMGRTFSWEHAIHATQRTYRIITPVLALATCLLASSLTLVRRWDAVPSRVVFAVLYFVISIVFAVTAAGGIGVDSNAFFDTLIALSMLVAAGVEFLVELEVLDSGAGFLQAALLVSVCAVFGLLMLRLVLTIPTEWRELQSLDAREREARRDIALIREQGAGQAACEILSLCYWAGEPFTLDFFNYGQKVATGVLPPLSCDSVFDQQRVHLVQIEPFRHQNTSRRLPPHCNGVIQQRFRVIRDSANGEILVSALE